MKNPVSNFAYATKDIEISRSSFNMHHGLKTTMSAGLLYPILCQEVIPGDTFSMQTNVVARMSTPIHPVMDDCYLDIYYFFVPNRIVWDHWKQFMGEPEDDPYLDTAQYSIPQLYLPSDGYGGVAYSFPYKSVLDYFGVAPGTSVPSINALPFRAFGKIWNEWFRDQNLMDAIDVPTDDADTGAAYVTDNEEVGNRYWSNNNRTNPDAYVKNVIHGGDLPPVAKYHDYFTSALKEPQKGDPAAIPLNGFAPVYAIGDLDVRSVLGDAVPTPVDLVDVNGNAASTGVMTVTNGTMTKYNSPGQTSNGNVFYNNLAANLGLNVDASNSIGAAYSTISDLRYAFQMQKFLETSNRFGSRYRELIYGHFGVTAPDTEIQVPEYLGGKRIHVNMNQVAQTSSTDEISPQGNMAAYSLTSDSYSSFTKSFTEHGFIIGVCCFRTAHTYSQGIEKYFLKKDKFDFYFPEFANISEQPIRNVEIYSPPANSDEASNYEYDGIFGYQEAWAEYRFKPNRISGEFRPTYPQSLDSWHYGDYYDSQPYLSSEWIRETRSNIDRTLAVSSDVSDQFLCDFYWKINATRPLPMYSIPGLADHH